MRTYFLSDLHLGAPYFPSTKEAERRIVAFLDSIKHDAEAIYLLGDVLDYWYEYRYVVPRGFVRFFGKLAELSDSGIKITWMIGNHDIWIFDYLPNELGIRVIDGSLTEDIYGQKIYMSHGDGVGRQPWTFRLIRSVFRSKICQFFYSGIHPRWTIPFAYAWSSHSRATGREPGQDTHPLLDNLIEFSKEYLALHGDIRHFIYGHLHILRQEKLTPEADITILGDWITNFSYAVLEKDGELKLKTHKPDAANLLP